MSICVCTEADLLEGRIRFGRAESSEENRYLAQDAASKPNSTVIQLVPVHLYYYHHVRDADEFGPMLLWSLSPSSGSDRLDEHAVSLNWCLHVTCL